MRLRLVILALFSTLAVFAQSDRGTITGTITDPTGGVVPNAPVTVKNTATGATFDAASSTTGNYTLSSLPAGSYEMSVTAPGFKKYVHEKITVEVAQTLRLDVPLEVGAASESVTINAEATMLKTESGELADNVKSSTMDDLPILSIGAAAGASYIRNPYAVTELVPGATWVPNQDVRVNGAPANTQAIRVEGQDSTNGIWTTTPGMQQPSVDAIQEFSVQSSNYAAEFGQAGGGVFNLTIKSGTNQFHGTAYDYFANEALNASQPFLNVKTRQRRNDFGGTIGGPVWIPKIYNGHNKTFFFVNFEQYRETEVLNNSVSTVPTLAYRSGDFSSALVPGVTLTDQYGNQYPEGAIYDPLTAVQTPNGVVESQFPGNIIPQSRLDPVALAIQSYLPLPTNPGLINNYIPVWSSKIRDSIPAIKIDHALSSNLKITGYWSMADFKAPGSPSYANGNGIPGPATAARGDYITANTTRISVDQTISPILLLHLGVGYVNTNFNDQTAVTDFNDVTQLGLKGIPQPEGRFPYITGLSSTTGTGGFAGAGNTNIGPLAQAQIFERRPTANASITWVKQNHTYKAGADLIVDGFPTTVLGAAGVGTFNFSANETAPPITSGSGLQGGQLGFPYASFLLGLVDNGNIGVPATSHVGDHAIAIFVQDSWKVTRKFTLDYGLRWDYQNYLRETYGRVPNFSETTPNPSAGGLPGAIIFEGSGPDRCNCNFAKNYPFAIGPRLGAAYQITSKTVVRAGAGVVYSKTPNNGFFSQAIGSSNPYFGTGIYQPATTLSAGVPSTVNTSWPYFYAGQQPAIPGTIGSAPIGLIDQNAGRPARQIQWSIGVQREIIPNVMVDLSYVGNRGAWWQANSLIDINRLTPSILAAHNIDPTTAAGNSLLTGPLSAVLGTPTAAADHITLPYAGFPTNRSVAQALRPFPAFGSISERWAPDGDTWYDALQMRVTKRFSHGLAATYTFAFQKEETIGAESEDNGFGGGPGISDVLNRSLNKTISSFSQPLQNVISINYTSPKWGPNKWVRAVLGDWTYSALLQYKSGLPIQSPSIQNGLASELLLNVNPFGGGGPYMNRVPGVPLFTQDLNCHCFDPNKTFVLNPAAWSNPGIGQFGSAAPYYNDYRYQRHPAENMGIGRNFTVNERLKLNVRAEFTNIFNRTQQGNPTATNSLLQTVGANGTPQAGFGYISPATVFAPPRSGLIVARFTF